MLRIFRTDIFMQTVIIVVTAVALWMPAILNPLPVVYDGGGTLYRLIVGHIPPRAAAVAGCLLVLLGGLLFNSMLYHSKMINQNTLLPMFFFVIAMSLGKGQTVLSPFLLGSFFLTVCVSQLMVTSTLLSLTIDKTFGAAAAVSLATLFCPSTVIFMVPLTLCMFNYSLYSWRDWTMLLLGVLAPYILVETGYLLGDRMFYNNYLLLYDLTAVSVALEWGLADWVVSVVFVVLLLVAMGALVATSQNKTANFKKNATAIVIFLVGSLLYGMYSSFIPIPSRGYAIPFAFSCTVLFYEEKKKEWIWNLALAIILLAAAAYNALS